MDVFGIGLEEGSREGTAVAELDVEYGESMRSVRLRLRAIADNSVRIVFAAEMYGERGALK